MLEIIHSTNKTAGGPWLIPRAELRTLDAIIEAEWVNLKAIEEDAIQAAAKENLERWPTLCDTFEKALDRARLDRSFHQPIRELTINMEGNLRVVVPDFQSALKNPALQNARVASFELSIRSHPVFCSLTVNGSYLSLRAGPEKNSAAASLFMAVQGWVDSVAPKWWQRLWANLAGLQWVLWGVISVIWIMMLSSEAKETSPRRLQRASDAAQVLKERVSPANEAKAMELILSYVSETIPERRVFSLSNPFILFFWGGLVACIALSFRPQLVTGLGSGENAIDRWSKWMNLVAVSVPVFIFTTFILPRLIAIVERAISP